MLKEVGFNGGQPIGLVLSLPGAPFSVRFILEIMVVAIIVIVISIRTTIIMIIVTVLLFV